MVRDGTVESPAPGRPTSILEAIARFFHSIIASLLVHLPSNECHSWSMQGASQSPIIASVDARIDASVGLKKEVERLVFFGEQQCQVQEESKKSSKADRKSLAVSSSSPSDV
jgi:hypothetical protein